MDVTPTRVARSRTRECVEVARARATRATRSRRMNAERCRLSKIGTTTSDERGQRLKMMVVMTSHDAFNARACECESGEERKMRGGRGAARWRLARRTRGATRTLASIEEGKQARNVESEGKVIDASATTTGGASEGSGDWSVFEEEKMRTGANGESRATGGRGGINGSGESSPASATRVRDGTSRHDRSLSKPYAVFRIDAAGQRLPYKQIMTRRQLLRDTDLSPRDLRRIDPSLGQANNTPAVIVREDSVLVNLGVRVIIRSDHALLLEPDTMMSVNFLESWTQRMSTAEKNSEVESLPFELVMVEASLQETCAQLANRLEHCTRRYRALERKLQTGIEKTTFDELRFMKQALVQLESRSASIRDELLETLDDKDDVERMTLSSKATEAEDKEEEEEEVENLLEYYLQQCEAVHSATEALLENTRDLDESISVTLSARRLEVSKIELMLSIASFAAAVGAVVTGIFGMNLTSTWEHSVTAFYLTTGLLITACVGMSAWLYRLCRSRSIL